MRRCSGAEAGISAELSTFGPLKPLKFHMPRTITLTLSPKQAADRKVYTEIAARRAGVPPADVALVRILKRSVDARGRSVRVNLTLELYADGDGPAPEVRFDYPDVSHAEEVVIVGGGPAGLFCALRLIESGYRPVILERGREVSVRRRDVAELNRNGRLDPDSNYAFGEGGAGTFSDGKLFTRSKKRGDYNKALRTLVFHGADEAILYEAHPHIGTDRLPGIMTAIRRTITSCGGEVRFGSRVTELLLHGDAVAGVVCGGERIEARSVVLATGHSADDVYAMLHRQGVLLQAKPFAMGVRVEHPQALIDEIQYHGAGREYLPAASYTLTAQVGGRGVYSFCMCPCADSILPQRGPGMRAASFRRLSTGSVSRRPSCAISAERAAFRTGNFKRMVHMELIEKYFGGELTPLQRERFVRLYDLYAEWNARINVVSRKDFDSLFLKHVLHSLAIACACRFDGGAQVCDVGTGGGFPAVPLAIFFPGAHFTAVDSIGKKITVVRAVASALGLDNLEAVNCRAEALPGGYDYVVSRAVTEMSVLKGWMWNKITSGRKGTLPNGMLVLKGGDLTAELTAAGGRFEVYDIAQWFGEAFFETKKVVYAPR